MDIQVKVDPNDYNIERGVYASWLGNALPDVIAQGLIDDGFAALTTEPTNNNSGSGNALPTSAAYATAIPLDDNKYSAQTTIIGATEFTEGSGSVVGGSYFVELVADGVNVPTFPVGWVQVNSASDYVNTNGAVNLLNVYKSSSTTMYSWTLLEGATPATTLQALTLSANTFTEGATAGTVIGAIEGLTTGSSVEINPADNRFAIDGSNNLVVGVGATSAGTVNVTLVETLAGATNTPRTSVVSVTIDAAVATSLFLDDDAAYANVDGFSLIQARAAQTNCIRVRRSNGDDERDIGFSDGVLDEEALLDFVGTGATDQGYVAIWYGTDGVNHARQTTLAEQPRIVVDGVVNKDTSRAALLFEGAQRLIIDTPPVTDANNYSIWAAASFTTDPSYLYGQDSTTNASIREATLYYASSRLYSRDSNGSTIREVRSSANGYANDFAIISTQVDNGAGSLYHNATNVANLTQIVSSVDSNRAIIGGYTTVYYTGSVSEILFVDEDSTAYFTALRDDRITAYGE